MLIFSASSEESRPPATRSLITLRTLRLISGCLALTPFTFTNDGLLNSIKDASLTPEAVAYHLIKSVLDAISRFPYRLGNPRIQVKEGFSSPPTCYTGRHVFRLICYAWPKDTEAEIHGC